MKHRSLGIFIILAASLAAIPQASQELAAIRDAVGQRARVELWNAFLDLQSGGTRPAATTPAPAAIASCETAREEDTGAAPKAAANRDDDTRREVKEQPRRAEEAETAQIIVDPDDARQTAKVVTDWTAKSAAAVRHALRQLPATETHGAAEFAMLVPPGESIEIDADAFVPALGQLGKGKGEWLRRAEIAELDKQASFDAAREREFVRRGQRQAVRSREELRRQLPNGPHTKGGFEFKGAEHLMKIFKVKTTDKTGAPVALAPRPAGAIYAPAPAPLAETE